MRLILAGHIFTSNFLLYQVQSPGSTLRFDHIVHRRFTEIMSPGRWSISLLIIGMVLGLTPIFTLGQTTNAVPFTPQGINSILGRNICDFQGEFPERFGVYLDRAKQYSVDYRARHGVVAVFLLRKPTSHCGIVDAALELTHQIRKGESVEFKCCTAHEGGTTWGEWGHVIGLADNENGLKRFVRPRLAWRVDIKKRRFERITGQPVTCDTSGYAD
jgi:hypothetical protein